MRRLEGGKTRQDGIPPSLFWESDVGKWYVAVFPRVRVVLGVGSNTFLTIFYATAFHLLPNRSISLP